MPQTKLENYFFLEISSDAPDSPDVSEQQTNDHAPTKKRKRSTEDSDDLGLSFPYLVYFFFLLLISNPVVDQPRQLTAEELEKNRRLTDAMYRHFWSKR